MLGVYTDRLVETLAQVLLTLGAEHALVVHSADGLDEISLSAATHVCELRDGALRTYELTPEELGLPRYAAEEFAGGDSVQNAGIATAILEGEPGPRRDIVAANAGAALYVAGLAPSIRDGVRLAAESMASGAALRKLRELIAVTNELGGPR